MTGSLRNHVIISISVLIMTHVLFQSGLWIQLSINKPAAILMFVIC